MELFTIAELVTFSVASLLLLIVPGPAVLYVIARSIELGRLPGLASAAGTGLGAFVHVIGAIIGLSAIIAASTFLFNLVKIVGACYLVYLGIKKLLENTDENAFQFSSNVRLRKLFFDGFVIETFNPKVAIFFLSFLPQFIHPERGYVSLQIFLLGSLFCGLALITDSTLAMVAGSLGNSIRTAFQAKQRLLNRVTGWTYISIGAMSLLFDSRSKN